VFKEKRGSKRGNREGLMMTTTMMMKGLDEELGLSDDYLG